MRRRYEYISGDSHVELSPEVWRHRVVERYRDRAPRLIELANGSQAWLAENRSLSIPMPDLSSGRPYEDWDPGWARYDGAAGAGTPEQRLLEQDRDGIDAEVLFTGVGSRRMCNGIADDDAYVAVVRGYNDWLAEEYCSAAPDRLIGLLIIPERGVDMALQELDRCAKRGAKGVSLGRFPSGHLYPTPEDDRFWEAALAMQMPLTIHSAGTNEDAGPPGRRDGRPGDPAFGIAERCGRSGLGGGPLAMHMVMNGLFERFPELQIYFAENQFGWVPNFGEQADIVYLRHHVWFAKHRGFKPLDRLPSDYLKQHFLWGFMDNPVGVQARHYSGADKLIWGSDFPHQPSDWPASLDTIERNLAGVPEDERSLMVAGNCMRFFHLDTFETTEERERCVAERRNKASRADASVGTTRAS